MKKRFYILLLISFLLSLADVQAQQKATPKAGEGISTFLLRHNRAPKKYYDDFVELNKAKLGKGNVLKLGVTYTIPPVKRSTAADKETPARKQSSKASKIGTTLHEPLFGKQLANVKVTSNQLAGACFYVVSGHGGPDPGAIGRVGKHELHEDEYAYDIALRLARNLMQEGAEVHIIIQDAKDGIRNDAYLSNSKRETCMGDPIPLNQVQRLQQRCNKINALYRKDRQNYTYCRAIFIHVDSRSKKKQTDVFFYNFAGYSGKFYSKKGANIKGHGENLFELSDPEAHLLIRLKNSKNNPIFEIIAPGNIKYTFKAIEITKRHALGFFDRSVDLECPHFTSQHYIPDTFDFNPEYTITSWYLTHIQYPTGDEIFFDYHRALNTYLSPMHRSDVTNHVVDVKDLKNPYYPIEDINHFTIENEPKKQSTISFEYIYEQPRLTGIRWTEGELEFVPAEKNREDIRTLPHAETEGAKMLGQINLYTKDRKKKLKSFLFHYSIQSVCCQ